MAANKNACTTLLKIFVLRFALLDEFCVSFDPIRFNVLLDLSGVGLFEGRIVYPG